MISGLLPGFFQPRQQLRLWGFASGQSGLAGLVLGGILAGLHAAHLFVIHKAVSFGDGSALPLRTKQGGQ